MAEDQDDKSVDQEIAAIRAALDRLEAAQRKDVADESSEEEKETPREQQPQDLKAASVRVREHFRRIRQQDQK